MLIALHKNDTTALKHPASDTWPGSTVSEF